MPGNGRPAEADQGPNRKGEAEHRLAAQSIEPPANDPETAKAADKENRIDQQDLAFRHLHAGFEKGHTKSGHSAVGHRPTHDHASQSLERRITDQIHPGNGLAGSADFLRHFGFWNALEEVEANGAHDTAVEEEQRRRSWPD